MLSATPSLSFTMAQKAHSSVVIFHSSVVIFHSSVVIFDSSVVIFETVQL